MPSPKTLVDMYVDSSCNKPQVNYMPGTFGKIRAAFVRKMKTTYDKDGVPDSYYKAQAAWPKSRLRQDLLNAMSPAEKARRRFT